jgi:hypothetical protein
MRVYIQQHVSEFHTGVAEDVVRQDASGLQERPETEAEKVAREANARPAAPEAPQPPWRRAIEPVMPFLRPIADALGSAIDLFSEMDVSPSKLAIGALLFVLVLSNLWSLFSLRSVSSVPRTPYGAGAFVDGGAGTVAGMDELRMRSMTTATEDVAAAVKGVLHEYFAASSHLLHHYHHNNQPPPPPPHHHPTQTVSVDGNVVHFGGVEEMTRLLDGLEARIAKLRSSLTETD